MRNRTKTMMLTGAVAVAGLGAFGGAAAVHAATTSGTSLAAEISSKFGLKQADVQSVIDSHKGEMQTAHLDRLSVKLDAAVKAGTITADQKASILAKVKELEASRLANRDAMKDKTSAERKTAMQAERDSLTKWATDNKIPVNLLMMGGGRGFGGHGPGGFGMHMDNDTETDDAPTVSPSPSATPAIN